MRIFSETYQRVAELKTSPPPESKAPEEQALDEEAAPFQGVRVEVSSEAIALSKAASDMDHEKVERLKRAVASGTLPIDADLIATRIVEGERS
jgi:flagellar biosynthesis anti-sigma factor FlgM